MVLLLSAGFWGGEVIADFQQGFYGVPFGGAVQQHAQPVGFVHVVGGDDAGGVTEAATQQQGAALHVHHPHLPLAGEAQGDTLHRHGHGKPLAVAVVAQHESLRIAGPEILRLRAEPLPGVGDDFFSCHSGLLFGGEGRSRCPGAAPAAGAALVFTSVPRQGRRGKRAGLAKVPPH